MNLGTFFAMLLFFTGAAVVVVWTIALAIGYVKRVEAKSPLPSQLSTEELDAIRARLAELEQRDVRVEEIEERLDFVERALGRSREGRPLPKPTEK
jgi:hypothetical protein